MFLSENDYKPMYTDKAVYQLDKLLKKQGYNNNFQRLIINDMCDFIITELIQLEAIRNEPLLNEQQKVIYNRRYERVKNTWKSLLKLYDVKDYFYIRQKNNYYYKIFKGGKNG